MHLFDIRAITNSQRYFNPVTGIWVSKTLHLASANDGRLTVEHLTESGIDTQVFGADPIRIIAATITGVSFLGAGTIIRQRAGGDVKGLTTAASLLFASVVGISVALDQWIVSVGATLLALIVLRLLPFLENLFSRKLE